MLFLVLLSKIQGTSVDCPNVINLAFGLHLNVKRPSIWSALQGDCCISASTYVFCDGSQRVFNIEWNVMGLDGSINGTALPNKLQRLDLSNNQIKGSIPLGLPSGIQDLYFNYNQLTGSIPTVLPSGLQQFDLSFNQFTGNIPTVLPSALQGLYLDNNQLNGSIPTVLPSALQKIYANNNQLTGSIPTALPSGLLELDVDGNQLTGSIPPFPSSITTIFLGYPGVPGNHFSGSLVLYKPSCVYINYNWITDVIIQNTTQLTSSNCDLSNNPLLGNPHISGLTMCTVNGLYYNTLSSTSLTKTFSTFANKLAGISAKTTGTSKFTSVTSSWSKSFATTATILMPANNLESTTSVTTIITTASRAFNFRTRKIISKLLVYTASTTLNQKQNSINSRSASSQTISLIQPQIASANISLKMIFTVIINCMSLSVVISKTPFTREIKSMRKWREDKSCID